MLPNELNQAREDRAFLLDSLVAMNHLVLTLQANTPGANKHHPSAYWLISIFEPLLELFPVVIHRRIDDAMGPLLVYLVDGMASADVKAAMMRIEDTHPLGRLIDLDVIDPTLARLLSRPIPRRCLLCEDPAFVCRRLRRHSNIELLQKTNDMIYDVMKDDIESLLRNAMLSELNLDPKFGLVTPTSQGSHSDMDYVMMKRSAETIAPYLTKMFFLPLSGHSEAMLFQQAREIGKAAETAMFSVTKQINTHKGLIFNLGLASLAIGFILSRGEARDTVFETIARLASPLQTELGIDPQSFGSVEYQKLHYGGARLDAIQGFPSVKTALAILESDEKDSPMRALVNLIHSTEDTVLLKRAGSPERVQTIQSWFANLDVSQPNDVLRLSEQCIEQRLSFGGAADLLVVAFFLQTLPTIFRFQH